MSSNFVQSAALRSAMLGAYRLYARAQVWRNGPRILVNSIPKAGTHLLTTELERFGALQNSRLHLEIPKISLPQDRTAEGLPIYDTAKIRKRIVTVRGGQFFSAHLPWAADLEQLLADANVRIIFMTRDPRAILVSRLHYIVGLRRHRLHDFLTGRFATEEARYRALIDGNAGTPYFLPLKATLAGFVPWMTAPGVLAVRFEDLVGERGGGSTAAKANALERIAEHCGVSAGSLEALALSTTKSTPTLRKGQANAWRDELPPEIAALVARECGPMLEAFGYPAI